MAFRMRKPELIPLLFILAATLLLGGLGAWQLQRLHWKEGLVAQMQAAQGMPAVSNPPSMAGLEYRNAVLTGTWLSAKGLRFVAHEVGGYVWEVPFKLDDSDTVVLVKLPWAPAGAVPKLDAGVVSVKGVLRPSQPSRLFSPGNRPDLNVWFTENLPQLNAATGVPLAPLLLDTTGKPTFRNDHLGYALTWFALMIIGWVMFAVYYREP